MFFYSILCLRELRVDPKKFEKLKYIQNLEYFPKFGNIPNFAITLQYNI